MALHPLSFGGENPDSEHTRTRRKKQLLRFLTLQKLPSLWSAGGPFVAIRSKPADQKTRYTKLCTSAQQQLMIAPSNTAMGAETMAVTIKNEVSYEGKVLYCGHRWDSLWEREYVLVSVWNDGEIKSIHMSVDTDAVVDATDEVLEAVRENAYAYHLKLVLNDIFADACRIGKGNTVVVVRGRKTPKGTIGKVFWIGNDNYSAGLRYGIKDSNDNVYWVPENYVEIDDDDIPDNIDWHGFDNAAKAAEYRTNESMKSYERRG